MKKKIETHIVPIIGNAIRLQEYGVGLFNATATKSSLKKLLKREYITVNGNVATTATWIKGGETIELNIPAEEESNRIFNLELKVLYEDDYLAVIHKPAGLLVSGNSFKTVANALPRCIQPFPSARFDGFGKQPESEIRPKLARPYSATN